MDCIISYDPAVQTPPTSCQQTCRCTAGATSSPVCHRWRVEESSLMESDSEERRWSDFSVILTDGFNISAVNQTSVLTGVLVPLQIWGFCVLFTSFSARLHLRSTQNIWRVYHQLVELQWRSRSESAGDVRAKRNIRVSFTSTQTSCWTHLETEQVRGVSNLNVITT